MVVFLLETCRKYIRGNGSDSHTLLGSLPLAHNAQHSLVSGAHAYNNNTRPDKVRIYGARYSTTRQFFSTTALHLLHVRRAFCTLVLFIINWFG